MRIAVDAMGGDSAPAVVVEGAIESVAHLNGHELALVGDEAQIRAAAEAVGGLPSAISVCHASEVVEMADSPVEAIRRKRDSSIARCVEMVASGEAGAVVSAGNTGAVVALATLRLRLLEGVRRAGIAVAMPTRHGVPTLVIDCGANVKCTPEHLLQYGIMAAAYSKDVLSKAKPTVGLLNIGEESTKGNRLVRGAHEMFQASGLDYAGYVEGRDIFAGTADVVVCEGFVGNVLLKVSEGVVETLLAIVKETIQRTLRRRIGGMLCKYALREAADRVDCSEFGGAPLLGVNGACMVAHGGSDSRAMCNAIRCAAEAVSYDVNRHIVAGLKAHALT